MTFLEEMPHIEAAARVSSSTVLASVQSLVAGIKQVTDEIQTLQKMRPVPQDRFVFVMQVTFSTFTA